MTEKTKPQINRADVLRMAQEAGAGHFGHDESAQIVTPEVLERFTALVAALVAAHEREACVKVCEAKAEEWQSRNTRWQHYQGVAIGALNCAEAIRARGAA